MHRGRNLRIAVSPLRRIKELCHSYNLELNETFEKTQLVISVYQEIVWGSLKNGDPGVSGSLEKGYQAAVSYLYSFPSSVDKSELQTVLLNLFQSEWFKGLINQALNGISAYARNGDEYAEILNKRFFSEHSLRDYEVYLEMRKTKSTYYRLRKEAILFLGVRLWGVILPELLKILPGSNAPKRAYMLMVAENRELVSTK